MSEVRNDPNRMNHHSGKMSFKQRAMHLAAKGEKAHYIAAFKESYSRDPKAASLLVISCHTLCSIYDIYMLSIKHIVC